MVEVSKHLFDDKCRDIPCRVLLHPWHENCYLANIESLKQSFVGSSKFYSLIFLIQTLMRGKRLKHKKEWVKMGQYYVRSTVFGALVSSTVPPLGCFFRWLQGNKMGYYTYVFLPSFLNGVFIFFEPPSRRGLVINLFFNLVIEYYLRSLERAGYISITTKKQTLLFMIGSSLLFYLMRLEGEKKRRTKLFWFYTPEKVRQKTENSQNVCPHEGSCRKFIMKGAGMYFALGSAFSIAQVLLPKIRSPLKALSTIRGKHFKMALFLTSYIGIYRAIICYLCRKNGKDSALYALPAGFLAGLSFAYKPNISFAIASLSGAGKLYSTILYENKVLPENLPLPELLYCICQGTLFHVRFMHPEVCPAYVFRLISGVTNGNSEYLFNNMVKCLQH